MLARLLKAASSSVSAMRMLPNSVLPCGAWIRPASTMAGGLRPVMSVPSKVIEPAVGRTRLEMVLSKVVLPWPLGPKSPIDSCGPMCSERPCSTRMSP
ncbi:hypothetical protein LCM4576_01585 [Mesorhizobium sp. LCM 4576]|nr:hypothetical protein LCM4576_01585 [Mesorhizobium sp. LCM 4576]